RQMWEPLGGNTVHVGCLSFVEVLRPAALGAHRLFGRLRETAAERAARRIALAVDAPVGRALRTPRRFPGTTSEPLTPAALVAHLPEVTAGLALRPAYDEGYLGWLFAEVGRVAEGPPVAGRVERGPLWAELVRRDGRVAGWYVGNLRRGGACRVLQLAARPRDTAAVLEQLVERAREEGAAAVYGRLEPRLVGPLSERRALLRFGDGRMLVHSHRAAIVDAILRGDALLTRLDGEWW
ncbi:MAG TPA: hypothetical protein VD813_00250, partial [Pseudonocardia sp.]|nr:hypothetical protein [Pseudonocardia sp.]